MKKSPPPSSIVRTQVLVAPEREVHAPTLPRIGDWYWYQSNFDVGYEAEFNTAHLKDMAKPGTFRKTKKGDSTAEAHDEHGSPERIFTAAVLMTVTHVGSNFIELQSPKLKKKEDRYSDPSGWSTRVHIDKMEECLTPEPNALEFLRTKTNQHRAEVAQLMGQIQEVTAQLGVGQGVLAAGGEDVNRGTAALVHSTGNQPVKAFKAALVKAQTKTLPELFEQVGQENRFMAMWMTAELLPLRAQAEAGLGPIIKRIDNRLFNVELYAGLVEEVKVVREGEPASIAEPIHLMQRRHYMDEECLAAFDANQDGTNGMDARNVGDFDKWLSRPENFERLLPFPRTVIAFRIRRFDASYVFEGGSDIARIGFMNWVDDMKKANMRTFLYLRNGQRLYRLNTEVEFGAEEKERARRDVDDDDAVVSGELFPDEKLRHLTGTLYAKLSGERVVDVITKHDWEERKEAYAAAKAAYPAQLAEFKKDHAAWMDRWSFYAKRGPRYGGDSDDSLTWDFALYVRRRLRLTLVAYDAIHKLHWNELP